MSVQGSCSIWKADSRICKYDNGTEICAAGHKIANIGTCFSQSIGTFNSTDASFQPTYSICTSDYAAINSSFVKEFTYLDSDSRSCPVYGQSISTTATGTTVSYGGRASSTFSIIWSTNWLSSTDKVLMVDEDISGTITNITTPSAVAEDWYIIQLDSGYVARGIDVTSGFFSQDVFGQVTIVSTFLVPETGENYYILKIGGKSGNITEISSNSIGITTNPSYDEYGALYDNPTEICVGDEYPPYITGVSPEKSGTLLNIDFGLSFVISDNAGGVDRDNLYVSVSGNLTTSGSPYIIEAGVVTASGATIAGSSSSYTIGYTPQDSWQENELVTVTVTGTDMLPTISGEAFTCTDLNPNAIYETWFYRVANIEDFTASITVLPDAEAPYVANAFPEMYSGSCASGGIIRFDILDDLTGVKNTSVDVKINTSYIVRDGVVLNSNATLTEITGGCRFTYSAGAGFTYGSRVVVEVYAEDNYTASPNVLNTSWYFDVINTSTVIIENFLPAVGLTRHPSTTSIEVDVYDSTYSLDGSSTYLSLNTYTIDTTKTAIYGNRDLTSVSGVDYLEGVSLTSAGSENTTITCTNISGDNISGGSLNHGYFTSGIMSDFPDPYSNTITGTVVTVSGYNGYITSGHLETTLVSGINWDGKYTCSTISGVSLSNFNLYSVDAYNAVVNSVVGYHLKHTSNTWFNNDSSVGVHTISDNSIAPVAVNRYYNIYHGYNVKVFGNAFDRNSAVEVFYGAANRERFKNNYYDSYYFTTRGWEKKDLTASIVGVIKQGDLYASINSIAPQHEYGATITVEITAVDIDGNELNYTFSYTIEDAP